MLDSVQAQALAAMAEDNIGAVCIGNAYGVLHGGRPDAFVFPEDIRTGSPTATGTDIAMAVLANLRGGFGYPVVR